MEKSIWLIWIKNITFLSTSNTVNAIKKPNFNYNIKKFYRVGCECTQWNTSKRKEAKMYIYIC